MEFITRHFLPSASHMVSGALQGRLLTQLVSMTRDGRVFKLGLFMGYGTACFLKGAANAGEATGVSKAKKAIVIVDCLS
jgi:predicted O-methyltransferase YrrM